MSGGGGGPIILKALIDTGQFTGEECKNLQEIADRSPVCVKYKDAQSVLKIVNRRLRSAESANL